MCSEHNLESLTTSLYGGYGPLDVRNNDVLFRVSDAAATPFPVFGTSLLGVDALLQGVRAIADRKLCINYRDLHQHVP